jgi:hypothetical protein
VADISNINLHYIDKMVFLLFNTEKLEVELIIAMHGDMPATLCMCMENPKHTKTCR